MFPPRRLSTSSLPPPVARSASTDSAGSEFGRPAGSKGPADWSGGGGGGVVAGHTVRRPVPRRQHSLPETQEQQLQRSIMELQVWWVLAPDRRSDDCRLVPAGC
ncbi:hypothetical protein HPB50_004215 [Hyalomma asiaticum]|uniref:Uncharacterized protein n=1 Tax=Hyalomma asiaticum TaxID=266040 RepID=A0ACB7SV95_HYAAI|nr:hypothetical protein HPB50_004215 [Hyalomma asiaticum]